MTDTRLNLIIASWITTHLVWSSCRSTQGRRNRGALRGHGPPPFERGETGTQVPLHTSIISNFMIYQDHLEANLLQLIAHTYNSEWFSIISVISFEANIVAKHVNAKTMTIMAMDVLFYYGYGCVCRDVKIGAKPGGAIERIALPKTYELTLFTMIAYN